MAKEIQKEISRIPNQGLRLAFRILFWGTLGVVGYFLLREKRSDKIADNLTKTSKADCEEKAKLWYTEYNKKDSENKVLVEDNKLLYQSLITAEREKNKQSSASIKRQDSLLNLLKKIK